MKQKATADVKAAIALAHKHHMQFVNLDSVPLIPESTLELLGIERATKHRAIPINVQGTTVTVAIDDPSNMDNLTEIKDYLAPNEVIFYVTTPYDMELALYRRYASKLDSSRC